MTCPAGIVPKTYGIGSNHIITARLDVGDGRAFRVKLPEVAAALVLERLGIARALTGGRSWASSPSGGWSFSARWLRMRSARDTE